jgi:hypothetical protein
MPICGCGQGQRIWSCWCRESSVQALVPGSFVVHMFLLLVASLVSILWPVASKFFELFPFLMQWYAMLLRIRKKRSVARLA